MKRFLYIFLSLVILLTACTASETPLRSPQLKAVTLNDTAKIIAGETIYVPVYSSIYAWEQRRTINLTATLSVRNTDLAQSIIVVSINYYDYNGQLVRQHLEQPVELGALSAASFVVDQEDTSGGVGAAFVVEWVAQQEVSVPVIEAVMINATGNQGISFISPGRVIKSRAEGN
jgi:hypothetical protein